MSLVTNVLLLTFIEDKGVEFVQSWLKSQSFPGLVEISEYAGGNKMIEHEIWAGAFNFLDVEEFVNVVRSAKWDLPRDVQLLIKKENDDLFHLRFGLMGQSASVTDCEPSG